MTDIASTPPPAYYAVIFTSLHSGLEPDYQATAERMHQLAGQQPGFLGVESARNAEPPFCGITVSYWESLDAIAAWKAQAEHQLAQQLGRERWYSAYKTRIARVERDYGFDRSDAG